MKISGEITLISRYRKQYMLYIIKHTHLYTMMVNLCRFSPIMLVMVKKGHKMLTVAVTGGGQKGEIPAAATLFSFRMSIPRRKRLSCATTKLSVPLI